MTSTIEKATIEITAKMHGYELPGRRAEALAVEVQSYLDTIAQKSQYLTFDDAPSDFDTELARHRR